MAYPSPPIVITCPTPAQNSRAEDRCAEDDGEDSTFCGDYQILANAPSPHEVFQVAVKPKLDLLVERNVPLAVLPFISSMVGQSSSPPLNLMYGQRPPTKSSSGGGNDGDQGRSVVGLFELCASYVLERCPDAILWMSAFRIDQFASHDLMVEALDPLRTRSREASIAARHLVGNVEQMTGLATIRVSSINEIQSIIFLLQSRRTLNVDSVVQFDVLRPDFSTGTLASTRMVLLDPRRVWPSTGSSLPQFIQLLAQSQTSQQFVPFRNLPLAHALRSSLCHSSLCILPITPTSAVSASSSTLVFQRSAIDRELLHLGSLSTPLKPIADFNDDLVLSALIPHHKIGPGPHQSGPALFDSLGRTPPHYLLCQMQAVFAKIYKLPSHQQIDDVFRTTLENVEEWNLLNSAQNGRFEDKMELRREIKERRSVLSLLDQVHNSTSKAAFLPPKLIFASPHPTMVHELMRAQILHFEDEILRALCEVGRLRV